jgi:hypothetical protein
MGVEGQVIAAISPERLPHPRANPDRLALRCSATFLPYTKLRISLTAVL